jgi:hypothetical protein
MWDVQVGKKESANRSCETAIGSVVVRKYTPSHKFALALLNARNAVFFYFIDISRLNKSVTLFFIKLEHDSFFLSPIVL